MGVSRGGGTIRQSGGRLEIIAWSEAASLTSPVGALVVDVDMTDHDVEEVETVLLAWAGEGRQPTTLLWIPPARGAARIDHMVNRLRYPHVFERASTEEMATDLKRPLFRILSRGGWIVPWFAAALGWSAEPFLVHVLSPPVLAERPPKNVKEWVRAVGKLSHAEFVALFREHGAPNPKEVHNRLVFSRATAWAAEQRVAPTRRGLAQHLRYSSGQYMARRAQQLAGLTYRDLVERPVVEVLTVLTRPILRAESLPPGRFAEASNGRFLRSP